jgi:hypothetical protein
MVAEVKPEMDVKTMVCQELEARPEEKPTPADTKPEVTQKQEVPVQDSTVMPVGEPEEEIRSITRKETMACRETTEACQEEEKPTSVDRRPDAAEHQEVPVEDAVVKPASRQKKRHRGKKQAAG